MMRYFFISSILCLHLLASYSYSQPKDSIDVTYIANCGFLIEMSSKKILIDALFNEGFDYYTTPDSSTLEKMTLGEYPFNNIELVFVTHKHADHFDAGLVLDFMQNNPSAKLICPEQVVEEIKKNESEYKKIKSRIVEITPEIFTSKQIEVDDIEIQACWLIHGHERNRGIQNIAYLIKIGGLTIFHTGDADPHQVEKYSGISLNEENILVGLINDGFGNLKNAEITRNFINAQYNVTMHLPEQISKIWLEPLKDQPGLFSNPFIFTRLMEQKTFYTFSD